MVNIGFKELIEKLEEYYGKAVTSWFIGLMGACFGIGATGFVVKEMLYPLVLWLGGLISGDSSLQGYVRALNLAGAVGAAIVLLLVTVYVWRWRLKANQIIADAERLRAEVATMHQKLAAETAQAGALVGQLKQVVGEAKDLNPPA